MSLRALSAVMAAIVVVASACSGDDGRAHPYSTQSAAIGASLSVLGWNISVTNLRFDAEYVLVDVDASASQKDGPHAKPEDIRFGLYGALAHPVEANGLGGCKDVTSLALQPLSAPTPDRLTGTVCLGPQRDQAQVRGIYVYSPRERIPDTTAAYPAAFPVGLMPTNENDTGLVLKTTSVDAFRADGADAARAGAEPRLRHLRCLGARLAGGIARRRPGPRVTVHAGRDQRGNAVCDGVGWRHPPRPVDD